MALRDFTDTSGNKWRVWNVSPHLPLRGGNDDEQPTRAPSDPDRDDALHLQRRLVPGLEGGWLCFETEEEKRRLNPIPDAWEELEGRELERLLEQAAPVSRRPD